MKSRQTHEEFLGSQRMVLSDLKFLNDFFTKHSLKILLSRLFFLIILSCVWRDMKCVIDYVEYTFDLVYIEIVNKL
jgi:hypothetical protein